MSLIDAVKKKNELAILSPKRHGILVDCPTWESLYFLVGNVLLLI